MQESTDLVLVQVRAIRSLLEAGGSRTSKTVEDVIMRHNDDVAVQIWSSLDPVEQARLLSDQNGTISALAFLATPEQIVRAYAYEPLFWDEWLLATGTGIARLQADVIQSFYTRIMEQDDEDRQRKILELMLADPGGRFLLVFGFIGNVRKNRSKLGRNEDQAASQEDFLFGELDIHKVTEPTAKNFLEFVTALDRNIARTIMRAVDEDERDIVQVPGNRWSALSRRVRELREEASVKSLPARRRDALDEEMFKPLE